MLPSVSINFENGNAGFVKPSKDGLMALVCSAVSVRDTFVLKTPYLVKSMKDVAKLGIIPDVNNMVLYETLREFYEHVGEGTELWLMGIPKNQKPSTWFLPNSSGFYSLDALLDKANGAINAIITKYDPVIPHNHSSGLYDDFDRTLEKAQIYCERYTSEKNAPVFVLMEAYGVLGDELPILNVKNRYNRVAVFAGSNKPRTGTPNNYNQGNHILAARLSKIQVHENAGKVKLGALKTLTAYLGDVPVELADVESVHDKGYITFRTHVRKGGYYISDDPMAVDVSDDYCFITRRRLIDKAYRIAYDICSEEVLNDFDLLPNGTISPIYAKMVEGKVKQAIALQMTAKGELSVDASNPKDKGVIATVNLENNVAQTGRVEMRISVKPKGVNRYFDVYLGYAPIVNS